jgi:hypothetical protein
MKSSFEGPVCEAASGLKPQLGHFGRVRPKIDFDEPAVSWTC